RRTGFRLRRHDTGLGLAWDSPGWGSQSLSKMRVVSAARPISTVAITAIPVSLIRRKAAKPQITVDMATSTTVLIDRVDAARPVSSSFDNLVLRKIFGSLIARLQRSSAVVESYEDPADFA